MIQTKLCRLLGIQHPIIQAAMGWICGPTLVAAVSNAGGLGMLGINAGLKQAIEDPDQAKEAHREQIRKIRGMTSMPFAMNVAAGPKTYLTFAEKYAELAIEEKVPVVLVSAGNPELYTERFHRAGIKVIHAVSNVAQAQKAEAAGVDAVVAQGYEGGGHLGMEELPTLALVPQVVDAVRIPVVAGGGIGDGRGLAAVLALGAQAAYVGTRFMATTECDCHPKMKQAIVDATDTSTVVIGRRLGTALMRQLRNDFTRKYIELEYGGASRDELRKFVVGESPLPGKGRYGLGVLRGDLDNSFAACGVGAGLVKEVISAGEVVHSIVKEAESAIQGVSGQISK